MSNRKTREQVIYNFGIGERCWHFPSLVDSYLKPPFNMITRNDLIERFSLQGLPGEDVLMARHGVPEVQARRIALAKSEKVCADYLDRINRLDAKVQALRKSNKRLKAEIKAQKHPWKTRGLRVAGLFRGAATARSKNPEEV
jgi:predicted RNase H-like nuclease (RuvC/YqgF family)